MPSSQKADEHDHDILNAVARATPGNSVRLRAPAALLAVAVTCCLLLSTSLNAETKSLELYVIDVEGGQATLVVAPSGQAMLIDTGWPGFNGRDADRIVAAAKLARVEQVDYLLITHYHRDHVGGVPQLASRIKIATFVDHGPNLEDSDVTREDFATYQKLTTGAKRLVVNPGDRIPMKGVDVVVLTARGEHLNTALPGVGQQNALCVSEPEAADDRTENAGSIGILLTYGKFQFIDLGDLTKRKEKELVCPKNLVGTPDLYLTNHHGLDLSNAKVLVNALHPRVAIMNNGPHKGGNAKAWETIHNSPGLEDLWQLHYAMDSDQAHNAPERLIANMSENCEGKYIKATAQANGSFTVLNSRNSYQKTYPK